MSCVQTLLRHRLVDRFVVLIHPLVLGTGRRLSHATAASTRRLRLVECVTTTTGVLIATYEPA